MALTWQVRWDRTIMYYVLERASDSLSFTPIGSVQSKGTDSTLQTYSFVDPQPLQGASYYRLTTEDTADHFVYRDTIGINVGNPALNLFIQPNPADSYVRVSIPDISQPSQLELVDMAGRVVTRVQVAQNVQQVNMATSTLDRGVYYLVWSNGASHSFRLLLIMRK